MNSSIRRIATVAVVTLVALAAAPVFAADAPAGVVNINTASAEQLALLPGVGPSVAGRIVEHREKNGAFKQVEDLLLVKGIGEKSLEKLKPYVSTSGSTTLSQEIKSPRAKKATAKAQG